ASPEPRHDRLQRGNDRLPRGPGGGADLRRRDRELPRSQPRAPPSRRARRGVRLRRRRPVVRGGVCPFGAAVATWFVVQAVLDAASGLGPRLEAITGFLAIVVLLPVLNWFVLKVYLYEWIDHHHR